MKKLTQSLQNRVVSRSVNRSEKGFRSLFIPDFREQEEINLQYLKQQGLVFKLNQKTPFEKQLLSILKDQKKMKKWNTSIESIIRK